MEIAPVPHRRVWTTRGWIAIAVLLFAPVTALTLVPTMFGLERYVMSSDEMDLPLGRGSVVLERVVPVSDLEVGDVITYRPPSDSGKSGLITHRIVDTRPGAVRTQGDSQAQPDPWLVSTGERPTMSRVVFAIPYIGLPFLLSAGTWLWLSLLLAGAALAAVAAPGWRRARRSRSTSRLSPFVR